MMSDDDEPDEHRIQREDRDAQERRLAERERAEFDRQAEERYARLMGDHLPPGERQRIHRDAAS